MSESPLENNNPGNAAPTGATSLKLPPQSVEAEQAVLGGLLNDNSAWDDVAEVIMADDFYRKEHRLIFEAMHRLANDSNPMDIVTISEALDSTAELDNAGGLDYLGELATNTPSTANILAYGRIIRERALLRKLIFVANNIADNAFNPNGRESAELLDQAEQQVFNIADERPRDGGPQALTPLLKTALDKIDLLFHSKGSLTGLSTGFRDLDDITSGLQRSDLIIIAGRPSMGKTSFAMNVVESIILHGDKPVLVFSLEMPADSLIIRMLSSLARIDQSRIRNGKLHEDDWPKLTGAMNKLKDRPLFIDDTPGLSPMEMRSRARRVAREHGSLGLILVDYLQLMQLKGSSENRTGEISEISRALKIMAREFDCPLLALSQLNRSLEQRPNKRPVMSDLRESGAIEQDADLIMFIYRDEVYHPDSEFQGMAELILAKHRNGPIGTKNLSFIGKYTRFENFMPMSAEADFGSGYE
ncbi:MAG: replicative DNA helicase [Pseudohongiellaceae bacterium]